LLLACCLYMTAYYIVCAEEKDIITLGNEHLRNKQYFNAITEMMRYQYLYPQGIYLADSYLIQGLAYYYGNNYYEALNSLTTCYGLFKRGPVGEKALYYMSYIRLLDGSPRWAQRTIEEYFDSYPAGTYTQQLEFEYATAIALNGKLYRALELLDDYKKKYPALSHDPLVTATYKRITQQLEKPHKSTALAVTGSILLPGFGHFYTGNYLIGSFSLATNAALIALIYDGIRKNNKFQIIFFSVVEFSFYQYSIIAGIDNVRAYNSNKDLYNELRLGIKKRF
jgi:hypothetical protein